MSTLWHPQPTNVRMAWIYVAVIAVCGAVLNAVTDYDPDTPGGLPMWAGVWWGLLYVPVLVWTPVFRWPLKDMGLGLTPWALVTAVLMVGLCGGITGLKAGFSFLDASVQAYARVGEEVFFRGFLYALLLRVASGHKRPWIWAVVGSTVAFTAVHTTAFRPEYIASMGDQPAGWIIVDRFLNVLEASLLFGLIRAGTHSIWPSALVHSLSGGGVLAVPAALLLLLAGWLWGRARGEVMLEGLRGDRPDASGRSNVG